MLRLQPGLNKDALLVTEQSESLLLQWPLGFLMNVSTGDTKKSLCQKVDSELLKTMQRRYAGSPGFRDRCWTYWDSCMSIHTTSLLFKGRICRSRVSGVHG
jgi:hypothetical protein